jgi:glycerol kinase
MPLAAYLAGLAVGFWKSKEDLIEHWSADRTFEPKMDASRAGELMARWHEAVRRSMKWEA